MRFIPVDPAAIVVAVVMGEPEAPLFNGEPRKTREGVPLHDVQVTVAVQGAGASTIKVRVAGEAPTVQLGQPVTLVGLRAQMWEMEDRHGVLWVASEIRPAGVPTPPAAATKRQQ
ncbi:hypothetical protein I6A84_30825 [Frankia sp. CNm7]|uniref:Regulatory protein n=2 Tax=Frankia nepalensis TaxID=1836974 RepID=A0A937RLA0_9ACTN|nr:hypothetical protein [Frankia nepalensis]MBL7515349.1 hypothetical protein [Frankia nepalensis]MBL7522358.1 hypothetical protein [Frankia nepalensis]MBL7632345.1 hypothetical protein [Frankia nepalensis]